MHGGGVSVPFRWPRVFHPPNIWMATKGRSSQAPTWACRTRCTKTAPMRYRKHRGAAKAAHGQPLTIAGRARCFDGMQASPCQIRGRPHGAMTGIGPSQTDPSWCLLYLMVHRQPTVACNNAPLFLRATFAAPLRFNIPCDDFSLIFCRTVQPAGTRQLGNRREKDYRRSVF